MQIGTREIKFYPSIIPNWIYPSTYQDRPKLLYAYVDLRVAARENTTTKTYYIKMVDYMIKSRGWTIKKMLKRKW